MNDPYIYTQENAIPKQLCEEIINYFEGNKQDHNFGSTIGGVVKDVKDTTDISISMINNDQSVEINKLKKLILDELDYHISEYYKNINNLYKNEIDRIQKPKLGTEGFLIQKYEKGVGKYIYHNDGLTSNYANGLLIRELTFIFYLNDVNIGGETEFMNTYKIRPRSGKILLFPSIWTYHHRGNVPISESKYIITGWLCQKMIPMN
jgi:hypothetical protein